MFVTHKKLNMIFNIPNLLRSVFYYLPKRHKSEEKQSTTSKLSGILILHYNAGKILTNLFKNRHSLTNYWTIFYFRIIVKWKSRTIRISVKINPRSWSFLHRKEIRCRTPISLFVNGSFSRRETCRNRDRCPVIPARTGSNGVSFGYPYRSYVLRVE